VNPHHCTLQPRPLDEACCCCAQGSYVRVVGNDGTRNSFTGWTSCWPCARRQAS
jgi:hypothetical protein